MPHVSLGTATLHHLDGSTSSAEMLTEAWRVGVRRFDTAPMYGYGRAEPDLGTFLAARGEGQAVTITTKVGLPAEPFRPLRARLVRAAGVVLPASVLHRLRGRGTRAPVLEMRSGRFELPAVQASVEESLRRLHGRVDRLLLHEVRPLDVTPELVTLLEGWVSHGDIGEVGVATQNHDTAPALARGGELFTVVNVAVGLLHEPVQLPEHVTTRVGHGLLGAGGEQLQRLGAARAADPALAERWRAAVAGTEFDSDRGLADALLSRGGELDVTELLIATRRLSNVARAHELAARDQPLPAAVAEVLAELAERARTT